MSSKKGKLSSLINFKMRVTLQERTWETWQSRD